jgi:hypothetical protein
MDVTNLRAVGVRRSILKLFLKPMFILYKILNKKSSTNFDVLLTVHLSMFNQFDAQNLFHNKFYFMPLSLNS